MELKLKNGKVVLPNFFPDGTRGIVKCVDSFDLEHAKIDGIVMNTYHLLLSPGTNIIKKMGGLNKFVNWNKPILTDSGGFQVFSLIRENPMYGEIRNNQIIFRPDGNKKKIIFTPEKCIQAQFAYGSDIIMCLDYCTHPDDSIEIQEKSVNITIDWAKKCKEEYLKIIRNNKIPENNKPLLFAIIQGGSSFELRKKCASELKKIGFDGYGFGGWPLDSEGNLVRDILEYTASLMPDDTPKYAMGVGKPEEIVECAKMGYNLFDCVIPTREARKNKLYVFSDKYNSIDDININESDFYKSYYIMDDKYIIDFLPVSNLCDCHLCKNFSRAYLRHLYKLNEMQAFRLATIHNLRFYSMLMELIRKQVIK